MDEFFAPLSEAKVLSSVPLDAAAKAAIPKGYVEQEAAVTTSVWLAGSDGKAAHYCSAITRAGIVCAGWYPPKDVVIRRPATDGPVSMMLFEANPSATDLVFRWSDGSTTRAPVAHPFVTSKGVDLAVVAATYPAPGLSATLTALDGRGTALGTQSFPASVLAPAQPDVKG